MEKVEKQPPFGKKPKSPEENAHCMIYGNPSLTFSHLILFLVFYAHLITIIDPSRKDLLVRAKEMEKYLARMKGVLAGTYTQYKYPLTPVLDLFVTHPFNRSKSVDY